MEIGSTGEQPIKDNTDKAKVKIVFLYYQIASSTKKQPHFCSLHLIFELFASTY